MAADGGVSVGVQCAPVVPLKPCSFHGPGLGMDVDVVDDQAQSARGVRGYLVLRQPTGTVGISTTTNGETAQCRAFAMIDIDLSSRHTAD